MNAGIRSLALGILGFAALASAGAAETATLKGVASFVSTSATLPLANGGAALHLVNEIVATVEQSDAGALYGDCAGLGYLDAEGQYSVRALCTFAQSETDGFAIEVQVDPAAEGTVKVIGGSGKWAGATGDGMLRAKTNEAYGGSFEYEFRIRTP